MTGFARDLGYDGPPFCSDEDRRALLRAELDAWYADAYGLSRDELRYIIPPKWMSGSTALFSESFRVLKEREEKSCGEHPHNALFSMRGIAWRKGNFTGLLVCSECSWKIYDGSPDRRATNQILALPSILEVSPSAVHNDIRLSPSKIHCKRGKAHKAAYEMAFVLNSGDRVVGLGTALPLHAAKPGW